MIKDKVLFLIFLIFPNYSLACEKEDFLTFVSAEKNKCIALQTIGEIKQNKKKLNYIFTWRFIFWRKTSWKKGILEIRK